MFASMPQAGPEPQSASAEFLPYQYATTPWPPSSVPFDTASRRSNAFTTAPAGSTSILRRPPVMSFTFFAKSRAYSWKMSFVGQVDWKRRLIGAWATWIVGAAATTAPAAPTAAFLRNERREARTGSTCWSTTVFFFMGAPPGAEVKVKELVWRPRRFNDSTGAGGSMWAAQDGCARDRDRRHVCGALRRAPSGAGEPGTAPALPPADWPLAVMVATRTRPWHDAAPDSGRPRARRYTLNKSLVIGLALGLVVGVFIGYQAGSSTSPPAGPAMGGGLPPGVAPGMPPGGTGMPAQPPGDNFQARITAMQAVVARDPKNFEAWVQLGNDYFDTRQPQKAIDAYARALELKPNSPNVLTDMGVMYRDLGQFDRAVANFQKANQLDPKHVQSLFNLGVVYLNDLKQPKKAIEVWNKVIQSAPQSEQAQQAKVAIEEAKKAGVGQ